MVKAWVWRRRDSTGIGYRVNNIGHMIRDFSFNFMWAIIVGLYMCIEYVM